MVRSISTILVSRTALYITILHCDDYCINTCWYSQIKFFICEVLSFLCIGWRRVCLLRLRWKQIILVEPAEPPSGTEISRFWKTHAT